MGTGWLADRPGSSHSLLLLRVLPTQSRPGTHAQPTADLDSFYDPVIPDVTGEESKAVCSSSAGADEGIWGDPRREGMETEAPFAPCLV